MKIRILLIFVAVCALLSAQTPVYAPGGENWMKVFSDEFNAAELDTKVWNVEHNSFNNSGNTKRDSANVFLEEGDLRLYIKKTTDPLKPLLKWTCGYIYTKETFGRNVYFEARMKTQRVSGVNNAFWLVTREELPTSYSNRYEIDINEIQYDINKRQHAAHLAWHDWKTYQYATDATGNPVDNALGAMVYYDTDDYQIWGFWLKDNEFHFYLNGQEIWNGITHSTHKQQWDTGVGKIYPWATQEEQRAYGKFKQLDWLYMGGYTGELMHVAFSNMMMALDWTPETDLADNSFMSVDWIRVFEPEKELNKTPTSRFTSATQIETTGDVRVSGDTAIVKQGTVKIPFDQPFNFAQTHRRYLSYWVQNPDKCAYKVSLLNAFDEVIGELSANEYNSMLLSFQGNKTSSSSVYPYAFYNNSQPLSAGYFVINRLTANEGIGTYDGDAWSVKLLDAHSEIPLIEPFYYRNIDETGQTSFNNQWSLNAKKITSSMVTALQIENNSLSELKIAGLRFGDNYLSVVADEVDRPFAKTNEAILRTAGKPDTLKINIRSVIDQHQVCLSENDVTKCVEGLLPGVNKIPVSPSVTTVYQLQSVQSGDSKGYVSDTKTTVFVPNAANQILYPAFDTYVQENLPINNFSSAIEMILKTDRGYTREGYMEFDISGLTAVAENAGLFVYLKSISPVSPVTVGVFAVEDSISSSMDWTKRPAWVKMTQIGQFDVLSSSLRYYGVDISEYLRERVLQNKKSIRIKFAVINGDRNALLKFTQYAANNLAQAPQIITTPPIAIQKNEPAFFIPSFDTFVAQQGVGSAAGSGNTENYFLIKNPKATGWGREGYLFFDVDIDSRYDISSAELKLHLYSISGANQYVFVSANGMPSNPSVSSLTWSSSQLLNNINEIGIAAVDTTDNGKYISWNVTDYVKSQIAEGQSKVTFKMKAVGGSIDALLKFDQSHNNTVATKYAPQLVISSVSKGNTTVSEEKEVKIAVYPNPVTHSVIVKGNELKKIEVLSVDGILVLSTTDVNSAIDLSQLTKGIYFVVTTGIDKRRQVVKIVKE